jgi:hypothetical protein
MNRSSAAGVILILVHCGAASAQGAEKPIQDNSFLLEEAYNQEPGVVQHINALQRSRGGDWMYKFTQEWPAPGQKHQLSYTVPIQRMKPHTGVGDLELNYRYQMIGDGDADLAAAPRFSLILPTGDERKGLGSGAPALEFQLPLSVVVSPKLVTHWNAGVSVTQSAKSPEGIKGRTTDYSFGQSFVWLLRPDLNLLLETVWSSEQSVEGRNDRPRRRSLFVSPGVRWAYNFASGLQVVPGVAVPVGIGPSREDYALFFYLSFEHPFSK